MSMIDALWGVFGMMIGYATKSWLVWYDRHRPVKPSEQVVKK